MSEIVTYKQALEWVTEAPGKHHLLLGNGFGMAYDASIFGYGALAQRAADRKDISSPTVELMHKLETTDFEEVLRSIDSTIVTLRALGHSEHSATIARLADIAAEIREALAKAVAGLHPDRPTDISIDRYRSVRRFLQSFSNIYTVNYDLLLYWSIMQEVEDGNTTFQSRAHDDGFRDSQQPGDSTVLWNIYNPHNQSVFYLHGALHLYLGDDGLRKITWVRTDQALIDQTRTQLAANRFPLYVAESESSKKLDHINRSAYLSRSLRSLVSIGGSLVVYGHSLASNDDHILEAIVRSKVTRLAVSLYGSASTDGNAKIIARGNDLVRRRSNYSQRPLAISFYDAQSVGLWTSVLASTTSASTTDVT